MKVRRLIACIVLLAVLLCACASDSKSVAESVDRALAQLEKPLGEAYTDMGFAGDPEDARLAHYLYAEDSAKILGKSFVTCLVYFGDCMEDESLTEKPTSSVYYTALLNDDYAYALRLYNALCETYGAAGSVADSHLLQGETADSLKQLDGISCSASWETEGKEIVLSVYCGENSRIGLEIQTPYTRDLSRNDILAE